MRSRTKRSPSLACEPFDKAMVLFNQIVEILALPQFTIWQTLFAFNSLKAFG